MRKQFLCAAVIAGLLSVAVPALAADSLSVRAAKAAKIVEIMRPSNFASLADFKIRQSLYEKLGPDMSGNIDLQQAMAQYSARDNQTGLKQHALAVFEGKDYRKATADPSVQDPFADDIKSEDAGEPMTMHEKLEQIKIEQQMKLTGAPAVGVAPGHVYIPAKTRFKMELVNAANSKDLKKGQEVDIRITDNLIVNGVVVIPKGTIGTGYVYDVRSASGFGQGGMLKIAAKSIRIVNNVEVPLRLGITGKGSYDAGAGAVVAFVSILGGAFMRGTNAKYPAGTSFIAEVSENVDLQTAPADLAKAMDITKPQGTAIQVQVP